MDATATPRGTPARVIARDNSTFPRSLRPSTVFVDSVLVKPAPTRPRGLFSFRRTGGPLRGTSGTSLPEPHRNAQAALRDINASQGHAAAREAGGRVFWRKVWFRRSLPRPSRTARWPRGLRPSLRASSSSSRKSGAGSPYHLETGSLLQRRFEPALAPRRPVDGGGCRWIELFDAGAVVGRGRGRCSRR